MRGVVDLGLKQDGSKALVMLNERFDSRNSATLLQAFLEVVNPPQIKKIRDIVAMVLKWESRVAALKKRYQEDINDQIRLAFFLRMLPQEYQDMIMQTSVLKEEKMKYETVRDHVLNLSTQRMRMSRPTPMDIEVWEEIKLR